MRLYSDAISQSNLQTDQEDVAVAGLECLDPLLPLACRRLTRTIGSSGTDEPGESPAEVREKQTHGKIIAGQQSAEGQ